MRAPSAVPVAIVLTSFDAGGTERQMTELVRRLDPRRWTVHVACLHARGPWHQRVVEAAHSVTEFPIRGFGRPDACRQALAFARWCTARRIEVVHTVDLYTNIFALPAAALARVPVRIGSRRGLNRDRSAAHLAMQRASYACAHAVVANSRAIAERLRAERVPASRIHVIHNGLDVASFDAARPRRERRRVIAVANLRPEKGLDVLLHAAAGVLQRHPDARFDLVGEGPERAALQRMLETRGLVHAVRLLGPRDDVPALLAASDIFVLPSRTESFPNAVLEAMAAALPVVASAVGGVPELVRHGDTGLLVGAGDTAGLADRLCALMDDAALGTRLGEAARRDVQQRFGFNQMVSAVDALYASALAARGRARAPLAA